MADDNAAQTGQTESTGTDDKDWKSEADKWKALARKHENQAKAASSELDKLKADSDSSKSDMDKIKEQLSKLTERAEQAEMKALKAEVAQEKGLSARQAARLSGKTREELESDADDLLETFGVKPSKDAKSDTDDKTGAGDAGGDSSKDGKSDTNIGKTRERPTELRDGTIPSAGTEKSGDELADEVWKRTRGEL